ncbi:MAG: citrate:proton symporter [Nesterenkonia sp.]|uniref:CitMHS family transporter n=1 Tax=Nesterenkonia marinintestina TaxID=2979865 RepID=UPI0021BF3B3D|nr:citrate:proton symporter [Nesterenkonia sp. GX14115]MDO5492482.1 citrate:proton symporter [Nesterenkonia sp.]
MDEPSTLLTLGGLAIIAVTVGLLMWNRFSPIVVMALVPLLGALLVGFGPGQLVEFFDSGVEQVMSVVVMFIFAILFFGILSDAGLFDPVVRGLILLTRGKVVLVAVGTALMGVVAHIDGAGATTFLLTIPALLPLYQALNMSRYLLLLLLALSAGIINMVPWGGPLGRAASVTGIDPGELYRPLIPLQVVGIVLIVTLAVLLGLREKSRIAKKVAAGEVEASADVDVRRFADDFASRQVEQRTEIAAKMNSSRLVYWANVVLALSVIAVMLADILPPAMAFLIGVAIALPLNFRGADLQMERVRAHAPNALMMGAVILGAAVFLGVLNESGMLESVALSALTVVPEGLGPNLHLVMASFGVPMDLLTSTDAYYFSVLPLVEATSSQFGVGTAETAHAMLIGNIIGTFVSPFSPALWLALGLSGANLGTHLRYSFFIVWGFSLLMLLAGMALGLFSITT